MRRKRQGGEEAPPLLLALLQARLVAGTGHQPMEGPNTGAVLCSPALGSPGWCRVSHPAFTFFSLSFPSFSPILTLSPLRRLRPSRGSCLLAFHGASRALAPFQTPGPHAFLLSSNKKVPSAAPTRSRRLKPSKNRAKPSPFLSREPPLLPGPSGGDHARPEVGERRNQTGQGPAWFLPVPINRKLGGGGEGEIMKFLIKTKK